MSIASASMSPGTRQSSDSPSQRLRIDGLDITDRNYAMWMHLSLLIGVLVLNILGPLVPLTLWVVSKDRSPFTDDHGREVINVILTGLIMLTVMLIPIVGWIVAPIWFIIAGVNTIRATMACNRNEYFRYPMTFRFV